MNKKMKKNSFVNGAFLVTFGIVISKILGVIYVIPFHALIGERGGALYGYAYSIYVFFISLSSAGIPLAISKIVSEYDALGNLEAKDRAFRVGKKLALLFGFLSFLILNIFASSFAKMILGNHLGGNSINDVTLVIRIISSAILVVPLLSIYRGYFQGHKFMEPSSTSQVLEQLIRIIIIIVGSFLTLRVFNLSIVTAVGIAVFAATVGALTAYFYLFNKLKKNKGKFKNNKKVNSYVSNKEIIKKIFYYAFPLIMIDLSVSFYNFIDTFTVVKGLVDKVSYTTGEAEVIMSMLSTWATKFNMIISSISTGIVVSLIPNLTQSIVKEDTSDINKKINQAISICLFLSIPMTLGISFLSKPIWTVFYGSSDVGAKLLAYFIFTGLFSSLFTIVITIIQLFKDYKTLIIGLLLGVLVKFIFNVNFITYYNRFGLPPYYSFITATLLGYITSIIYCFIKLKIKSKVKFKSLFNNVFDIIAGSILMTVILLIVNLVIRFTSTSRVVNLFYILLFSILGVVIYLIYAYKSKLLDRLLGKDFINKIKKEIN